MKNERFSLADRLLHWTTAIAVSLMGASGWFIWRGDDEWEVLGVNAIAWAHVWVGGMLLFGGAALYLALRRRSAPTHGWNPGQRIALRYTQVVLAFLAASGILLQLRHVLPMDAFLKSVLRNGHGLGALAIAAFVGVHMAMLFLVPKNRGRLGAMLKGTSPVTGA